MSPDNDSERTAPSFDEVRQLCIDFSQAWDAGPRPSIADYLEQIAEGGRETLLRNLLEIEIDKRRTAGDEPSADECVGRFPQHQNLVRQLFQETCQFSADGTHPSHEDANTQTQMFGTEDVQPPSARRLGPYRLIRELGRGGMGYVFEAVHVQRGERVALKTLPLADAQKLHLFKREFRTLADTDHPNLVALHALEQDGDQWFFTMELLSSASSFVEYVRPQGTLDEHRLRESLRQLTAGVSALHARGIVHRDIKPSNVMVTPEGNLKLLDFGLVMEVDGEFTQTLDKIVGTPIYMAPEQAAGGDVTMASDWYAVGIMLYEALAGKVPFSGSMLQVLQHKQTREIDREPLSGPNMPQDLVELCLRLLSRKPGERPNGGNIASVICPYENGLEQSPPATGEFKRIDAAPALLGREFQLQALAQAYENVQVSGEPAIVFVCGRSGEGKSALVAKFLADLRSREDITLLSGRCYDREFVPFKALDSLIDALASHLRTLDAMAVAILLPDDTGLLAQVFPVLGRVEVIAKRPTPHTANLDDQQVRKRAFAALRELLRRIALESRVIMFSDDLQWGDADSAEVLMDVLGGEGAPSVLFLGSFRSDEADGSPFLNTWHSLQQQSGLKRDEVSHVSQAVLASSHVEVAPLTLEHCIELVSDRVGATDPANVARLAEELHLETGGNAFFLSELIEFLDAQSLMLERIPLAKVIANKLAALPSDAADLLHLISVSGKALSVAETIAILVKDAEVFGTIGRMRNVRLVRMLGDEKSLQIDTYHDKIREAVLGELPADHKEHLHLQLAEAIEKSVGGIRPEIIDRILGGDGDVTHPNIDRIYDLSAHFLAGADEERSAIYSLLAAEQAQRQFSNEVAIQQYSLAYQAYRRGLLSGAAIRMFEGFAKSLLAMGDYSRALEVLDEASRLGPSKRQSARIQEAYGDVAFRQARMMDSFDHYFAALRHSGQNVPTTRMQRLRSVPLQLIVHLFRDWLPKRSSKQVPDERERQMIRLFAKASNVGGFAGGEILCWPLLRGINFSERFSETDELARKYAMYAIVVSTMGLQKRAARYQRKALDLLEACDDRNLRAVVDSFVAVAAFGQGDHESVGRHVPRSLAVLQSVGDPWMEGIGRFHFACSYFAQGRLDEAIIEAHRTFTDNHSYGGTRTNCATYLLERASDGKIDIGPYMDRMVHAEDDVLSTCNLDKAQGIHCLTSGQTDEAIEHFERACALPLKALLPNFHAVAGLPFLITALRSRYEEQREQAPAAAQKTLRRAWKLARRGRWFCVFFPVEYPYALREYALVAGLRGKMKTAMRFLERSRDAASKQGAAYELAQSRYELARLQSEQGTDGMGDELRAAEQELERFADLIKRGMKEVGFG